MSMTKDDSETTAFSAAQQTRLTTPKFPEASTIRTGQRIPLDRFLDVQVEITVEIGRATTTLGELLNCGIGAVIELDRNASDPVDVVAQGARIGRGEVVVVDDRFAVKITELDSGNLDSTEE